MPDDVPLTCEGDRFILIHNGGHVVPFVLHVLNGDGVVPPCEDHGVDAVLWWEHDPMWFLPRLVVC